MMFTDRDITARTHLKHLSRDNYNQVVMLDVSGKYAAIFTTSNITSIRKNVTFAKNISRTSQVQASAPKAIEICLTVRNENVGRSYDRRN